MGKQIRFVLTQNKQKLLGSKIVEYAGKHNLVVLNHNSNSILENEIVPNDKYIALYLVEKNFMENLKSYTYLNQIEGLIENSLEISMNVSDDNELCDYSRVWIDNKQYREEESILFKTYKEMVKFIKKESLGYDKEETDWMLFEEGYLETYKKLKEERRSS